MSLFMGKCFMTKERLLQMILLNMQHGAKGRGEYLKKVFYEVGENVFYQPRVIPLYPKLIKLHSNIMIASNVSFITHDAINVVLDNIPAYKDCFKEEIGCIEIMSNVFVGAGTAILYNTRIGENVIIGARALVNKDLPANGVYAGIPAKYITSFDNFVNKKLRIERAVIEKNQNISEIEVQKAWKLFLKSNL